MRVDLDRSQLDHLIELAQEYRNAVASNEVSGYGQSKDDELIDSDQLLAALRAAE